VSNIIKACILRFICPGDDGTTIVPYKGEVLLNVPKDHPLIKFYGALDAAEVYTSKARILASSYSPRLARALKLIHFALMHIGFYVGTGDGKYARLAESLLIKAAKLAFVLAPKAPVGWIVCEDEVCSTINEARVWSRWAERRAVSLKDKVVLKVLNQANNILFELMRSTRHVAYLPNRLHVEVIPSSEEGAYSFTYAFSMF